MFKILEKSLRILHPFMPFVTEEIWQRLNEKTSQRVNESTSIMIESWPHIQEQIIDKRAEKDAESIFDIITQIRNLRSSIELKPEQKVKVSIYAHTKARQNLIESNRPLIVNLAKLEDLNFLSTKKRPKQTLSAVAEDTDLYLHFTGLLDIAEEERKIKDKIDTLEKIAKSKKLRLNNKEFIKKAPEDVVMKEKQSLEKLSHELKRLKMMRDELH
jgi:valyl-tRNA synthetase